MYAFLAMVGCNHEILHDECIFNIMAYPFLNIMSRAYKPRYCVLIITETCCKGFILCSPGQDLGILSCAFEIYLRNFTWSGLQNTLMVLQQLPLQKSADFSPSTAATTINKLPKIDSMRYTTFHYLLGVIAWSCYTYSGKWYRRS